jgi:hypothetical protein
MKTYSLRRLIFDQSIKNLCYYRTSDVRDSHHIIFSLYLILWQFVFVDHFYSIPLTALAPLMDYDTPHFPWFEFPFSINFLNLHETCFHSIHTRDRIRNYMKLRPAFSSFFASLLLHNRVICYDIHVTCRDSWVGIATGYGLEDGGVGIRFPKGSKIFLFSTSATPALGPTQSPIQCVTGALSPGIKL